MINEPFRGRYDIISPADRWEPVVPNDNQDLPNKPRLLHAVEGGIVRMADATGTVADFLINSGQSVPLSPHRIFATGTTASGLVACW